MRHLSWNGYLPGKLVMTDTTLDSASVSARIDAALVYFIAATTFGLAGICFTWYARTGESALLLLGWVTFGTAFDFFSHILGAHVAHRKSFLRLYARVNFAALCFGIPFTALAGSFVIAALAPDGFNAHLIAFWPQILFGSLAFGALFLVARYRRYEHGGAVGFTLDKQQRYTRAIFIARRAYLALALAVGIAVMVEGFGTPMAFWAAMFGISFIATVPLHIMHKHIPSMLSEAITLNILAHGSWLVFVR